MPLVAMLLHGTSTATKGSGPDGSVVEVWFAFGVLLAGLGLAAPVLEPRVELGGLVAGVLLAAHRGLSTASSTLIGSVVASSIVSVGSMTAAFLYGCILLDDTVWSTPMAVAALSALALGATGICWAPQVSEYVAAAEERSPLLQPLLLGRAWEDASAAAKLGGIGIGVAAGVCGGAVLVPCVLLPSRQSVAVLPSLGVGALVATTGVTAGYSFVRRFLDAEAAARVGGPHPGVITGGLWGLANGAALCAIRDLGYARTYPLFHCHMMVVMLWQTWGKEPQRRAFDVLVLSSLCLLVGGVVLFANTHQG